MQEEFKSFQRREQRTELIEAATLEWWQAQEFPKIALKSTPKNVGSKPILGSPALLVQSAEALVKRAA